MLMPSSSFMEMQLGFPAGSNFIGSMVHPRVVAIFAIVCILRFGKSDYFYYETICDSRKNWELRLQKYKLVYKTLISRCKSHN